MSAETDYVQQFVDKKFAFLNDPEFRPSITHLPWLMDVGLEITIVEANQAYAYWDHGVFHATISPGQKSYIRADQCHFIQAATGVRPGPGGGVATTTTRVGLAFPNGTQIHRFFGYPPNFVNWEGLSPFRDPASDTLITSIEISLAPFRTSPSSVPVLADGQVHIRIIRPDGVVIILTNIRYDSTTHQLIGYHGAMEGLDYSSIWILAFFISPGLPE
jgi:hypothetical protein